MPPLAPHQVGSPACPDCLSVVKPHSLGEPGKTRPLVCLCTGNHGSLSRCPMLVPCPTFLPSMHSALELLLLTVPSEAFCRFFRDFPASWDGRGVSGEMLGVEDAVREVALELCRFKSTPALCTQIKNVWQEKCFHEALLFYGSLYICGVIQETWLGGRGSAADIALVWDERGEGTNLQQQEASATRRQ